MSLYKDASLVMIPSAYKDGKLYSIRPTDGSGDFTFSRGSNLAATRVDVNGLIEKGRENLLLQSNQFDTTWFNSNSTETSGQSGYDGSNNAWLLTKSAAGGRINQSVSLSGVQTLSIYAKAGTLDWLRFITIGGTTSSTYFDLANGSVGSVLSSIDTSITSIGNGWYRCSVTTNQPLTEVRIYPADADNDTSGTSGNIYIQDSQLEAGLVATDYIETGASTAQAGILEDMPRLDYSGGASCPALLLEPQRTNLIEQSEYFEGSDWSATLTTITSNSTTSPEGLINATKLVPNNGATNADVRTNDRANVILGQKYVFSTFAKKGEFDKIQLDFSDSLFGDTRVVADLTNGTITAGSANVDEGIEDYGNGWYRIYLVGEAIASGTNARIFRLTDNGTGDGTSGVYVYGAQWEASSSYPTSYIPTYGASVTRSSDSTGNVNVSSLGVTIGYTLFYELGDYNVSIGSSWLAQGGTNGRPYEVYGNTAIIKTASGDVYPFGHLTAGIKVAVSYDGTNINVFTNGTKRGTWAANKTIWDAMTNLDMTLNNLQMVNWKQLVVFPTGLTDSECIALTTL